MSQQNGFDWQGFTNYRIAEDAARSPFGVPQMVSGFNNFAGNLQGGLGQMGAGLQANAQRSQEQQQQQMQMDFARQGRDEQNRRFNLLYDTLLKPRDTVLYDEGGMARTTQQSPLIQALMTLGGYGGYGGLSTAYGRPGAQPSSSYMGGGFGSPLAPSQIPSIYG